MIIQNRGRAYEVLRKLGSAKTDQYLCREVKGGQERDCRIAAVPIGDGAGLIPYLDSLARGGTFRDLLEYFMDTETLYIVMAASRFPSLEEKMAGEACGLSERLAIGRNLLTALLLTGADSFFCRAALGTERICVSPALEIGFQYDMEEIRDFDACVFHDAALRLASVFSFLFRRELGLMAFPEMEEMIGKLKGGDFPGLLEVYGWYQPVCDAWMGKAEQSLRPESRGFRLWELTKKLGWLAAAGAKLGLVAVAAAYLAFSVAELRREPAQQQNFTEIGAFKVTVP